MDGVLDNQHSTSGDADKLELSDKDNADPTPVLRAPLSPDEAISFLETGLASSYDSSVQLSICCPQEEIAAQSHVVNEADQQLVSGATHTDEAGRMPEALSPRGPRGS